MHKAHDFHFFYNLREKEQNVLTRNPSQAFKKKVKCENKHTRAGSKYRGSKKRAIQFLPVICLRKKGFLQDCTINFFQITKTKSCNKNGLNGSKFGFVIVIIPH